MKLDKKITVVFALPNLLPGGAERVMSYIAQKIDRERFDTTLLVIGHAKDASYDISGIKVVYLGKDSVSSGAISFYKFLRKTKPDLVISAIGHLNALTAVFTLIFRKIKFIAREVNVLSVLSSLDENYDKSIKSKLADKRFNFFDTIICQSQDMLDDLKNNYKIKDDRLVVINNPITDDFKVKKRLNKNNPIQFITVARFDKEKGHDRILEALSMVDFDFHYTIIGRGKLHNEIFTKIEAYNLTKKVTHIPFTKKVGEFLTNADLYLQGSYTEGFPNSIIESCMVGTPVLAYNAPGGINEILNSKKNGVIVNTVEEFKNQLYDINERYDFNPIEVSKTVSNRYSSDIIVKKYENLFLSLIDSK
ncbi:glycosyltransferase [Winogradskyella poriferorum]|uniref:glycosyltransferase n=1 Tax=Winogradskyella poriferorum TaxID=307627 RepID=UPI003D6591B3